MIGNCKVNAISLYMLLSSACKGAGEGIGIGRLAYKNTVHVQLKSNDPVIFDLFQFCHV
jgi:hypothetical protein